MRTERVSERVVVCNAPRRRAALYGALQRPLPLLQAYVRVGLGWRLRLRGAAAAPETGGHAANNALGSAARVSNLGAGPPAAHAHDGARMRPHVSAPVRYG